MTKRRNPTNGNGHQAMGDGLHESTNERDGAPPTMEIVLPPGLDGDGGVEALAGAPTDTAGVPELAL